jgi:hypothetical protein
LPPPSPSAAFGRAHSPSAITAVATRHRLLLREFALMWPSVNRDAPHDGRPDSLNDSFTKMVKWQRKRKARLNSLASLAGPERPERLDFSCFSLWRKIG